MTMSKILDEIKKSDTIGITFHISPDGDSIGSSLALFQGLKKLNKDVYILSKEDTPENFSFLPCVSHINKDTEVVREKTQCVIVLDCGNFERVNADICLEKANRNYTLLNIDHHVSNELYGDLNFVSPKSSCMAEIVYYMLISLGVDIDKNIATCLYTSILTDTGSFRHSNTTALTHDIAGKLIDTEIDFSEIHRKVFDNKEFNRLKLYGLVFENMELVNDNICIMKVTKDMFEKLNIDPGKDTSDIVYFGNQIKTVEVTILLKEKNDDIKVSLRSKSKVDVRKIAEQIGGGGHIRAAGAAIKGKSLQEAKDLILNLVKKEF